MEHNHKALAAAAAMLIACAAGAQSDGNRDDNRIDPATDKPVADLSGRARTGIASFYAAMFFGRKMADGTPMNPDGDNAASRTLPLGTKARVTNLKTGESAIVTIQDRGPYVKGRIVDLSPATARQIGITPQMGLAKVEVTPIFVPLPNGTARRSSAANVAAAAADRRAE